MAVIIMPWTGSQPSYTLWLGVYYIDQKMDVSQLLVLDNILDMKENIFKIRIQVLP